jgi:hypothetical protein
LWRGFLSPCVRQAQAPSTPGWADLDALTDDEVTTECPQITTPETFGALLDTATTRFLDTGRSTAT